MTTNEQCDYFNHMYQHYIDCGWEHGEAWDMATDALETELAGAGW